MLVAIRTYGTCGTLNYGAYALLSPSITSTESYVERSLSPAKVRTLFPVPAVFVALPANRVLFPRRGQFPSNSLRFLLFAESLIDESQILVCRLNPAHGRTGLL